MGSGAGPGGRRGRMEKLRFYEGFITDITERKLLELQVFRTNGLRVSVRWLAASPMT